MTLIAGLGCSDGIVIAADSASTDTTVGTKQPALKIRRLGKHPILYGGSGDVGLIQCVDEALQAFPARLADKPFNVRKDIKKLILPHLAEARDNHIAQRVLGLDTPPVACTLFCGIVAGSRWILEIEIDGRDTLYSTSDFGYFAAIGSGKAFAQALFRPHLYTERYLKNGKVMLYRILDDSILLAAGGLAHPIRMYTITTNCEINEIDKEELQNLNHTCELWREKEREALGESLAPPKSPINGSGIEEFPLAVPEP